VIASRLDELVLDRAVFDELVAHARSDFPYEVCGLIGLRQDGTAEVMRIGNAERSMRYYVMDSRELLRAMRRIEDEQLGLVIYHSHTHTRAYPSATDPSERSLTIVARVEVSLSRVFSGQEQLCDVLDRCADVSHHLLDRAPAWLGDDLL
jgi:proteasome lid subunit RPN8/RPN11